MLSAASDTRGLGRGAFRVRVRVGPRGRHRTVAHRTTHLPQRNELSPADGLSDLIDKSRTCNDVLDSNHVLLRRRARKHHQDGISLTNFPQRPELVVSVK